jgi:hypothetical protein
MVKIMISAFSIPDVLSAESITPTFVDAESTSYRSSGYCNLMATREQAKPIAIEAPKFASYNVNIHNLGCCYL